MARLLLMDGSSHPTMTAMNPPTDLTANTFIDGAIRTGEPSTDGAALRGTVRLRIHLWDLPLRLFHWLLVLAVSTAVITGELGGAWMTLHGVAGLTVLGLLVFRLVWGAIGSTSARFAHFAPTPTKLMTYLRGRWKGLGHNPLGALSVFALLGLLLMQAGSGLFSNDDISFAGPLATFIEDPLVSRLTGWHKLLANGLLALSGLHLAAIGFHLRVKKDNLVGPMVTGWKVVEAPPSVAHPARQGGGFAAFVTALALALTVIWALTLAPWLQPPSTASAPPTKATPSW